MSGTKVKFAVEHLSSILDWYLDEDLDSFSREGIASTIKSLAKFQRANRKEDELFVLRGLVAEVISHLYVARGLATPDVPRVLEYYKNMNTVQELVDQITGFSDL